MEQVIERRGGRKSGKREEQNKGNTKLVSFPIVDGKDIRLLLCTYNFFSAVNWPISSGSDLVGE